jgi:hypothetical protein
MSDQPNMQRLSAILAADAAGRSRLRSTTQPAPAARPVRLRAAEEGALRLPA